MRSFTTRALGCLLLVGVLTGCPSDISEDIHTAAGPTAPSTTTTTSTAPPLPTTTTISPFGPEAVAYYAELDRQAFIAELERQEAAAAAQRAEERRIEALEAAQPVVVSGAAPSTGGDVWEALARCESGMTNANTGNGYYGYFQFSASTWHSVGGSGLPTDHGYEEQLSRAQALQARSGWGQWPGCSRRLGLR